MKKNIITIPRFFKKKYRERKMLSFLNVQLKLGNETILKKRLSIYTVTSFHDGAA